MAISENGVFCVSSRTVTPPPIPISGCSVSLVSLAAGGAGIALFSVESTTHATTTAVTAKVITSIAGVRLRDCTGRCYVCF